MVVTDSVPAVGDCAGGLFASIRYQESLNADHPLRRGQPAICMPSRIQAAMLNTCVDDPRTGEHRLELQVQREIPIVSLFAAG